MSMLEKIGFGLTIAEFVASIYFAVEVRKFIGENMEKTMEKYGVTTPQEGLKAIAAEQAAKNQKKWFEEAKRKEKEA